MRHLDQFPLTDMSAPQQRRLFAASAAFTLVVWGLLGAAICIAHCAHLRASGDPQGLYVCQHPPTGHEMPLGPPPPSLGDAYTALRQEASPPHPAHTPRSATPLAAACLTPQNAPAPPAPPPRLA